MYLSAPALLLIMVELRLFYLECKWEDNGDSEGLTE